MIGTFLNLRPLAGKLLLDVGASPHGFALEPALGAGVRWYCGIGLGIHQDVEVRESGRVGALIRMNAELLDFEPETFDLIISLSTFEHFADGARVLREMYRVLKPGGSVLVSFQPIWTSARGHHLHHLPEISQAIPAWGHLIWTADEMRAAMRDRWPASATMSLEEGIDWIYTSNEINRASFEDLEELFRKSPFEVEWLVPLTDELSAEELVTVEDLAQILPYSKEHLISKGFSALLNRR